MTTKIDKQIVSSTEHNQNCLSSPEMFETVKKMIDPSGCLSMEQLNIFFHVCQKRGLDPLLKQIYGIPHCNRKTGEYTLTILTSIDGFRLIAERTGCYAPGPATQFQFDDKGSLLSATAFVKKRTADGTWHEVSTTAFLKEYRPKNCYESSLWVQMPTVMLAKCAEAACLRRAFPDHMSGLYTAEEMDQAKPSEDVIELKTPSFITEEQCEEILLIADGRQALIDMILSKCKDRILTNLEASKFDAVIKWLRSEIMKEENDGTSDT